MTARWVGRKTREIDNSARHAIASDTDFKWLAGKWVCNQKMQDCTK